jgi:CBS domain-containing protein
MQVSDILRSKGHEVVSVAAGDTVAAAVAALTEHRIGAVLVFDERHAIAGILSERDLVHAMHRFGRDVFNKTVGELMTAPVITCSPHDPVAAIMGLMTAQRCRHLPVVDGERVVGLVSIGDIVKSHIDEAQAEMEALRRYIAM